MSNLTFIKIKRLPLNPGHLFYELFPRKEVATAPAELLFDAVLLDIRHEFLEHFQEFGEILREKRIPLYLICDFDPGINLASLVVFEHVFLFQLDDLPPSEYELLKEAARRFFYEIPLEELYHLPRFLGFGYTELQVSDADVDDALLVLDLGRERFCSNHLLADAARRLGQFKRLIACPLNVEQRIRKVLPNHSVVQGDGPNLKAIHLYWLDDGQMGVLV